MSNTAVPIRPIAKGSLARLAAGVAVVAAVAGGLAWVGTKKVVAQSCSAKLMLAQDKAVGAPEKTDTGLLFQVARAGQGPSPTDNDVAIVSYRGTLADGKVFDENPQAALAVAESVPGFSEALKKMQRGGAYRLCLPPALAYGDRKISQIPANSALVFDVELQAFGSMAEYQMMQQMMQMRQAQEAEAAARAAQGGAKPAR